ncbi:MAG: GDP-L-fucose synthase [Burkholderiaceae bacterium]|nr:GDP-L-fucose synthase [Burkholderiaceae bacterium]
MDKQGSIFVAGHRGLVGSALVRALHRHGYANLLLRTREELDLTDQASSARFFEEHHPQYVLVAAARVGGIFANETLPAQFIRDNLLIQANVLHQAWKAGVQRLLFLGSSCIYPRDCPQPIREEALLTGPLEPTNSAYALAKIAGVEMCRSYNRQYGTRFLAAMPTNLYGPDDNFDLQTSHVLPALVRKMLEARAAGSDEVAIWGSGTPRRELLHSDDLAEACMYLMALDQDAFDAVLARGYYPLINIGFGEDLAIRDLAELIAEVVGFTGRLVFDRSKPDGTPRKLLDSSRIRELGWRPKIDLRSGVAAVAQLLRQKLAL